MTQRDAPTEADMGVDLGEALNTLYTWLTLNIPAGQYEKWRKRAEFYESVLCEIFPIAAIRALHAEARVTQLEAENIRLQRLAYAEATKRISQLVADNLAHIGIEFPNDPEMHPIEQTVLSVALKLQNENARLQDIIASQSDALARVAKGSATARLEAWRLALAKSRWWDASPECVTLQESENALTVVACPAQTKTWRFANAWPAGTDERPATLDQMILAALAKWEEAYSVDNHS